MLLNTHGIPRKVKCVLVGDTGVGKTSLVSRLVFDELPSSHIPTIGAAFSELIISGRTLSIWDTAGQEKYASLAGTYLREANISLVVFDLIEQGGMDRITYWIQTVLRNSPSCSIIVVGNKCDKGSNPMIAQMVREMGHGYVETSATTGAGVYDLTTLISSAMSKMEVSWLEEEYVPLVLPGDGKARCC